MHHWDHKMLLLTFALMGVVSHLESCLISVCKRQISGCPIANKEQPRHNGEQPCQCAQRRKLVYYSSKVNNYQLSWRRLQKFYLAIFSVSIKFYMEFWWRNISTVKLEIALLSSELQKLRFYYSKRHQTNIMTWINLWFSM